jgi:hypothetical protein
MADITSANAIILLSVPLLLPVPQQLQGFATDDIFDVEDTETTETRMGADGILSGGVIFMPTMVTFTLQADSPSISFFESWDMGQQTQVISLPAQGNITLTSIGRSYQLVTGFLTRDKRMPDAKRVLEPRKYRVAWQQIIPVPIGAAG